MDSLLTRHAAGALLALACAAAMPRAAGAHEFWIEPLDFTVEPGGEVAADVRIGQDFVGDAFPYVAPAVEDAGIRDSEGDRPLTSPTGALPAVRESVRGPGLDTVWIYTTPEEVLHPEWDEFAEFAEYEGIEYVLEQHRARGLPTTDITELFARCAKALVAVGDGAGEDTPVGMPFELVAEANPYAIAKGEAESLPVKVLWQGEPLADVQIRILRRAGEIDVSTLRTDDNGEADIPLGDGGTFVLAAVHIVPWDDEAEAEWFSYWATLTFEVGR